MTRTTFADLAAAEPRLLALEADARALCADERMTVPGADMAIWSGYPDGFRRRMEKLVGWFADNPDLQSEQDWNIAAVHFSGLLQEINDIASGRKDPSKLRPATVVQIQGGRA